jgi:hypothetical protein
MSITGVYKEIEDAASSINSRREAAIDPLRLHHN